MKILFGTYTEMLKLKDVEMSLVDAVDNINGTMRPHPANKFFFFCERYLVY